MWLVDGPGGRANAASQHATCAMCGLNGSFIQQIVPNVFAYLRLKKHVSNSNSCESLIYMNKERGLAKKVVWYDHSHDTRNLLYGFPHCVVVIFVLDVKISRLSWQTDTALHCTLLSSAHWPLFRLTPKLVSSPLWRLQLGLLNLKHLLLQ